MARPVENNWKTPEAAEQRAQALWGRLGPEAWAEVRAARGGLAWGSMWRLLPQGNDAEERVAGLLERASRSLGRALQVADRVIREWAAERDEPLVISSSLEDLRSKVARLALEVERTAAEARARVDRNRRRDSFRAERFRDTKPWRKTRRSRAEFIREVLRRVPGARRAGGGAWAYAGIALGYDPPCSDANEFHDLSSEWRKDVRRVAKALGAVFPGKPRGPRSRGTRG